MGLDMYLTKKRYFGLNHEHNIEKDKETKIIINGEEIDYTNLVNIEYNIGYWRKANAIHDFFVRNVQDGEDDCREYFVSLEILIQLRIKCKKLIELYNTNKSSFEKKAKEILPTTSGFFFGSTEYDEFYIQDLNDTIEIIDNIFNDSNHTKYDYYYRSSW